ncbi:L-rhamnose-binding lectin CSL3-like [Pimephales promelas]|uniref:L-rhamnose-binding lectin CSL3-like n=1 Tax=Pimephales promelas TaxID=90988 RepID=UPI001955F098|nr:L-rhamnose-binding lectin CSL3-like [Pimephales promelas]
MNTYASLRDFQSFPLIPTFNMLVQKLSWIILLLFLSQHGIEALAICEGGIAVLSCEGSFGRIRVIRATYGRTDRRTCADGKPYSQISNTRCRVTVTNTVSRWCHGRERCVVPAYNSLFGDPCVGTYKYLDLTYTCRRYDNESVVVIKTMNTYASLRDFQSFPLIPTFNMLVQKLSWIILLLFLSQHGTEAGVICEGGIAVLSCERSFGRISVIQATYGRTDRVACARGIPNSQTSNTSCLANATNKVSHRCNGRKRCVVPASNSLFGDPCVGTFKYLHVTYTCQI